MESPNNQREISNVLNNVLSNNQNRTWTKKHLRWRKWSAMGVKARRLRQSTVTAIEAVDEGRRSFKHQPVRTAGESEWRVCSTCVFLATRLREMTDRQILGLLQPAWWAPFNTNSFTWVTNDNSLTHLGAKLLTGQSREKKMKQTLSRATLLWYHVNGNWILLFYS